MTQTQRNFVKGAAVLGLIGVVCKVIGAIYRIPMTNLIGTQGMAYYNTAYPVYVWLLVISSAGLPVAISKMVSERVTLGDFAAAHQVFKTSLRVLTLIGLVTTTLMALGSGWLSASAGRPAANISLLAIAPSLLFVALLSAYRGYFQGLQMMTPTALSQLIEQLGKLIFGLFFASLWKANGIAYGAAGAVLGVTLSEALALAYIMVLYRRRRKQIWAGIGALRGVRRSRGIGRELFVLAFPIVLGALAIPSVQTVDMGIITNTLLDMGYTEAQTDSLYGALTGVVTPLVNMPAVLSLALAMSLVPAISTSVARGDAAGAAKKAGMGIKLALLVGLPCAVGFWLLARPIIYLLFSSVRGEELAVSAGLLTTMSAGVLFLSVVQTATGVLQGLGKTYLPVINLFIGVAVKLVVSLVMIRMPAYNIKGAAVGTVACYAVAAVLNIICVMKHTRVKLSLAPYLIKPALAAGVMGIFVYFAYPLLAEAMDARPATVLAIAAGAAVYAVAVFAFGALKKEDMAFIPGGRAITRLFCRLRVW